MKRFLLCAAALTSSALANPVAEPLIPNWTSGPASYTHTLNLNQNEVRWFVINVSQATPYTVESNTALHIDTDGSPAADTSLALFSTGWGYLICDDADSGEGQHARLTFGIDDRPGVGDGLPFDGRDGDIPYASEFFVAVTAGPATFDYGFTVNGSAPAGQVVLHVESVVNAATLQLPPSNVINCGTVCSDAPFGYDMPATATWHLNVTSPSQVTWLRFHTDRQPNQDYYFDIDTAGSTVDTASMAIFDYFGRIWFTDNDGPSPSVGPRAFSFGGSTYRPNPPAGLVLQGQSGELPPESYWLAVVPGPATFQRAFTVSPGPSGPPAVGDLQVNIRTNFNRLAGRCSPADMGACGGTRGSDNNLDNNDFVVFIDYFFEHRRAADMGSAGGVAVEDGRFDNNDFVVFIDEFFTGRANCHG
jgi:hypothetical protein